MRETKVLKTQFSSALKRFAFICDVVASATARPFLLMKEGVLHLQKVAYEPPSF